MDKIKETFEVGHVTLIVHLSTGDFFQKDIKGHVHQAIDHDDFTKESLVAIPVVTHASEVADSLIEHYSNRNRSDCIRVDNMVYMNCEVIRIERYERSFLLEQELVEYRTGEPEPEMVFIWYVLVFLN